MAKHRVGLGVSGGIAAFVAVKAKVEDFAVMVRVG